MQTNLGTKSVCSLVTKRSNGFGYTGTNLDLSRSHKIEKNKKSGFGPFSSKFFVPIRAVLRGHQKAVFRRQKRTTFDVKNSTYLTFYVGHSTRQGISLLRVPNRITHDVQPHTSQLHSVQLTLIFTIVRYFE